MEAERTTGFSDSNDISCSSSIYCSPNATATVTATAAPETHGLRRLSDNLELILESPEFDFFADVKIVATDGREVAVHRCILCARSPFFKTGFSGKEKGAKLELKESAKGFSIRFDSLVVVLGYLYSGKVKSLPKGVCDCVDDDCSHEACRPAVEFLVELLYASFTFQISELVSLYQRRLLDILNRVDGDDILLVLSIASICGSECEKLLARCIDTIVSSYIDVVTLDKALPQEIVKQIIDLRLEIGFDGPECTSFPDKHVRRIYRALDSDDVELVRMLLQEGQTTLDDAFALHYAVAYCDPKTTMELLDLAIADVNCRNSRGCTVLHVAAMRKEPKIIVSLLTKGAWPSDLTLDGKTALQISKRLTKASDYFKSPEEGKDAPKDKLCVEILETAEKREPSLGEASFSLATAGDDLRMKLLYLENRVALARLLFPMEAKVAMDIAQVGGTSEFSSISLKHKNLIGNQGRLDLNEAPFTIQEEYLNRMRALSRTVELGKRFFPRCSNVLDKIMDADDFTRLVYLTCGSAEEQVLRKRRFEEIQVALGKAFNEDKEEFDRSSISSSSSSTSLRLVRPKVKLSNHHR